MSELANYIDAVNKRRAYDKKRGGVNVAVLMQLEDIDIPMLLEIIRLQDYALRKIIDRASEKEDQSLVGEDADYMAQYAASAHLRVEELASHGSKARWGDYEEPEDETSGDGTAKTYDEEDDGN